MSLVSSNHPISDSGLTVALHPLILLTISDYITRQTLRHQQRPIVGALLGQQHGRSITLEHAFECETVEGNSHVERLQSRRDGGAIDLRLHDAWFQERLQQYKDVHKAPALELMGWFTTTPETGPQAAHLPIHQQILQTYNETAVLLAFHPTKVTESAGKQSVGGKLPLAIYESFYESAAGDTGAMEVDSSISEDAAGTTRLDLKFRELPYSVETGEAEMIGVDFVARGGGNATAVNGVPALQAATTPPTTSPKSSKGKTPVRPGLENSVPKESKSQDDLLSPEDEELIATLTARANAVRMLHTRITQLKTYLTTLPPSYLTQPATSPFPPSMSTPSPETAPNHPLLRSISALLARLPLLTQPPSLAGAKTDTELVALLAGLGASVRDAKELGRKFAIVEGVKAAAAKKPGGGRERGFGGDRGFAGGWDGFGGGGISVGALGEGV